MAGHIDTPHFASPFTMGKQAKVIEQDSDEDLVLCVSTLLRTETGSRDELPEYGVDDLAFKGDVSDEVVEAIRDWEPRTEADADSDIRDLIQTVDVTID